MMEIGFHHLRLGLNRKIKGQVLNRQMVREIFADLIEYANERRLSNANV